MSLKYFTIDGTVWPVNVGDLEHQLRYPDGTLIVWNGRLRAASVIAAYSHMTDPSLTEEQAHKLLIRARRAQKAAR